MPECQKRGCHRPFEVTVVLNDPTGQLQWNSCIPHAEEFHAWVREETERVGGHWSAVFTATDSDILVVAVDGSDG